jgi:hypothetical protein
VQFSLEIIPRSAVTFGIEVNCGDIDETDALVGDLAVVFHFPGADTAGAVVKDRQRVAGIHDKPRTANRLNTISL